jgi:Pyruvate/2-oxoacid:ferredoxin oxidoreductase delta subunit
MRELLINSPFFRLDEWEDRVAEMPGAVRWSDESPARFEIVKESIKRGKSAPGGGGVMSIMAPTMLGIRTSLRSLGKNTGAPKKEIPPETVAELKAYLLDLGASSVGFTRVPEKWVFQNKGILHTNAVVLTMEMDKVRIGTAPSQGALEAVLEIYRDLGRIANKGADFLRTRGFSAHAGHPLMGLALYPPLAQAAGLGWLAANGLIVTPEHGPRVRLAAIYTSAENLPFSKQNEHAWVADFCQNCLLCVRKCPPDAIRSEPVRGENGQISYVINERCFPYFSDYYGCSVCIKVCPFNQVPYEQIKEKFEARNGRVSELVR